MMKKKNKMTAYFILIVIIGFVLLFNFISSNDLSNVSTSVKNSVALKITSAKTWILNTSVESDTKISVNSKSEIPISSEFKKWFENEVNVLNTPVKNQDSKEADLKKSISNAQPQELIFLADQAMNMNLPANVRILSVYLLTLSPEIASEVLLKIIKSELTVADSPQPHSIEETLSMQEKTIRRMAIDSLILRAKTDLEYRSQLWLEIQKITDQSLKDYALKGFQDI